ncbi:MAG: MBL fold metallo-hydrolase [Verrucomicrobia bacterium]|nr:MBL fold metallo-hydrolase [Verrucomicrobiota bacterium]
MTLEDHCGDVIGKARRSAGVSIESAARAANLSVREFDDLEQTGRASKQPDFKGLGNLLQLHGVKLQQVAEGWLPQPIDLSRWQSLRQITTSGSNFTVNAYMVWDAVTRETALFDTGFSAEPIFSLIEEEHLQPSHLFITHSHHDHIEALGPIRRRFPEIRLHSSSNGAPSDQRNQTGQIIRVGGMSVSNRPTPGHAEDGVTYLINGFPGGVPSVAVVGDAIFAGSIGGARELADLAKRAIREHIFSLPAETLICPGHGPVTTVSEETAHNPFFV